MSTQLRKKGHKRPWNDLFIAVAKLGLSGLWDDETDKNPNIQERELQPTQFARNRKSEQDSLKSMMSFITNRYRALVHALEFCSCILIILALKIAFVLGFLL